MERRQKLIGLVGMKAYQSAFRLFLSVFIASILSLTMANVFVTQARMSTPKAIVGLTVDTEVDSNSAAYRACTDLNDEDCSLRGAISRANVDVGNTYVITLPPGIYTLTIVGDSENDNAVGDLDPSGTIMINGGGITNTIIQAGPAFPGVDRIFHLQPGADVTIQQVALRHGVGWGSGPQGGAINVEPNATLYLYNSFLTDNHSAGGGALNNEGTAIISNTVFIGNSTDLDGGALRNWWTGAVMTIFSSTITNNQADIGGGISSVIGLLTVRESIISNNQATRGGALYNHDQAVFYQSTIFGNSASQTGGAIFGNYGQLTVNESTISNNNSDMGGGGIYNNVNSIVNLQDSTMSANTTNFDGGSIYNLSVINAVNSTISGNMAAGFGGGIYNEEDVHISNSTFAGNVAFAGGAIAGGTGNVNIKNSILTNSNGGDCTGLLVFSGSHNLIDDATCGADPIFRLGAVTHFDPVLQNNGGSTETHAIFRSSNAVDNVVDCTVITTSTAPPPYQAGAELTRDQRGDLRPTDGNGDGPSDCDIGAYEVEGAQLAINKRGPVAVQIGDHITYTLQVTNSTLLTLTGIVITDTIPSGAYYVGGGTQVGNVVSWTVPTLPVGGVLTRQFAITATHTITNSDYRVSTSQNYSNTGSNPVVTLALDVPISGLTANNNSPTPLTNPTILSVTITEGSNVSYFWDFGDGQIGVGQVVTHTYPIFGVYAATVTATNSVSTITATTVITIDMPVTGLTAINNSPIRLGELATMTATVTTGSNVAYMWDFGDGGVGSGSIITHTYEAVGSYTVELTAINSVSQISVTVPITVLPEFYMVYLPVVIKP